MPPGHSSSRRGRCRALLAAAASLLVFAQPLLAREDRDLTIDDILSTPIESLMNIRVTTVAGSEQDWFESPAALYVVTGEDVRRTGHRTLADALRVVPGVFVGQTTARGWVVGMRGFSGGLANKTLVLIDGRAAYDPLFAGTFWDVQDVLLEDVERIEVIRGPGATLWGANAVNGVINVITKHTKKTQGVYLEGGGGTEEHGFGSARYGGRLSDKGWYRAWGKYFNRDDFETSSGQSAHDAWDLGHGGFRIDLDGAHDRAYTLQGDVYDLDFDEQVTVPVPGEHLQFANRRGNGDANGGNVLFRASGGASKPSGWSLQMYYDRTDRRQSANFTVERDTADVDFRHRFALGSSHNVVWGLGYRYTTDDTEAGETVSFDPGSRSIDVYSGFFQDTVTLVPDRVFAMVGTKLDHNTFSGFEVQPSGRLWWTPDDRHTLWAAISRPVRTPSRTEHDAFLTLGIVDTGIASGGEPSGEFSPIGVAGNPDAKSERLLAYEIGYRTKVTDDVTADVALFYNDYSRLLFVPPTTVGEWTNAGSGESYGGELSTLVRATDRWTLSASYTYVDVQIHGPILPQDEGNSPHHQLKARSYLDITDDLELNTALYFVDRVPTPDADSYVRLDIGLSWRPYPSVELSIWGQNLLEETHRESSGIVEVERAAYAGVALRF